MENYTGVVFIHGAGLGTYIWEKVTPYLKNPYLLTDFPGREKNYTINNDIRLGDYCNHIIKQIENWKMKQLVIVTHSIGGVIGLKVAEHFESRVMGFVGIASSIPANGGSFLSCLPLPKQLLMGIILRIAGTKPPDSAIKYSLCNDLSSDLEKKVIDSFVPESKHLFLEKSNVSISKINALYIRLSDDNEFPIHLQDKMIRNLDPKRIITLKSGHLPMMSIPKELAEELKNFIQTCENDPGKPEQP